MRIPEARQTIPYLMIKVSSPLIPRTRILSIELVVLATANSGNGLDRNL
jgi:hypothetical protein